MHTSANIGYIFQHVAAALSRQNDQVLQERLGIGYSQLKLLLVLGQSPYIQQRKIAESLGQTEASISRQIKLMTRKGLLRITINPNNRRQHLTTLTERGARLTDEATSILNAFHEPLMRRFTKKECANFQKMLLGIHLQICQPGKPGVCDRPF